MKNRITIKWSELLPDEFLERQKKCPVVYLPMGLCEPHGPISAFGLDTIKAEFICEVAACEVGGIVAPTQGYHIHETGYHAPWLEENIGEVNPYMASIPPDILLHLFLYQLRSFSNAGFKGAVVITGHAGGNQDDLRMVADAFMKKFPLRVEVRADPELVEGKYVGDHAGKYEISQLMYIRPDLIDMSRISRKEEEELLGRFALGPDAAEASYELGEEIITSCVEATCEITEKLNRMTSNNTTHDMINFKEIEMLWIEIAAQRENWATYQLHHDQKPAGGTSKWKMHEHPFS